MRSNASSAKAEFSSVSLPNDANGSLIRGTPSATTQELSELQQQMREDDPEADSAVHEATMEE
jgi:hypothetical protein